MPVTVLNISPPTIWLQDITTDGSQIGQPTQEQLDPAVTVTINDAPATLGQIVPGDHARASGRPITSIAVTR